MKYNPSVHAVERIRQYFGIMEDSAKNFANQLMESAKYVTTQTDGKCVYKHDAKDVMIVVDTKKNVIVTVLPPNGEGNNTKQVVVKPKVSGYNAIIEKAREVITKEIAKARRQFTKETRKLTLTEAEIGFEIATLALNKARARNPLTQASIEAKINELEQGRQAVFAELLTVRERFEQMRRDAEGYL
jgi:hypothetical protein